MTEKYFHPLIKTLLEKKIITSENAEKLQGDILSEKDAKNFLSAMFSREDLWLPNVEQTQDDNNLLIFQAQESLKSSSWKNDDKRIKTEYPVWKLVNQILRNALSLGVSDVHIEPQETNVRVRFRLDGVLKEMKSIKYPIGVHEALVAIVKMELAKDSNMVTYEHSKPQDWRAKIQKLLFEKDNVTPIYLKTENWDLILDDNWQPQQKESQVDLRISILPEIYWEKIVFRLLDTTKGLPKIDDMGYTKLILPKVKNRITMTQGLILVTWPTWSWKSTTLYSILNEINRESINIQTFEDPIEHRLYWVNQCQVDTKEWSKLTFADWLRAALRQDPDVILVWEIRDKDTAHIAIEASNTWHLVYSTLHQNDSTSVVERLFELDIDPKLLSASIIFVSWQRLTRKLCNHCKIQIKNLKSIEQITREVLNSDIYKNKLTKKAIDEKYSYIDMNLEKNKVRKFSDIELTQEVYLLNELKLAKDNLFSDSIKNEMLNQLSFWWVAVLYGAPLDIRTKPDILKSYRDKLSQALENSYVHDPKGCKECNFTGYSGRVCIQEVFFPSIETRKIIGEAQGANILRQKAIEEWFITMLQDWYVKCLKWLTDYHDIQRVVKSAIS